MNYKQLITEAKQEIEYHKDHIEMLEQFVIVATQCMNGSIVADAPEAQVEAPMPYQKKGRIQPGGVAHACLQLMTGKGPMPIRQIVRELRKVRKLSKVNPWADVSGAMMRHPSHFQRVSKGVYTTI